MYYLIVYDVDVSRLGKVYKFLKTYMNWVQNSVFEGELTESEVKKVKKQLSKLIDKKTDSILIYSVHSKNYLKKEVIGVEKREISRII